MLPHKEVRYIDRITPSKDIIFVGDIGGTNCNFGLCLLQNDKITLLASWHIKSRLITDFTLAVKDLVDYIQKEFSIVVTRACFGAAGVISDTRDQVKPTNLSFVIDVQDIQQATGLQQFCLMNDFEAVGYGIEYIQPKDLLVINKGLPRLHASKAILGAGTGLGKAIMAWSPARQRYVLIASEGGHADAAIQTQQELDLMFFIRHSNGKCNVSWEDILSGKGIQRIYQFLGKTEQYEPTEIGQEIERQGAHPDQIFSNWSRDKHCFDTFNIYGRFYGRCAKNFTLDTLALSGLYIAGGIAAKNLALFEQPGFWQEFINCGKQAHLLKDVPLYIIADYNVSLYGAAAYLLAV